MEIGLRIIRAFPGRRENVSSGYAIIATGGKQHKVTVGDRLRVELLEAVVGDTVTFADVLAVKDGDTLRIGTPKIAGAKVTAKVVEQDKAAKVLIFKKKKRKQYRRTRGHRQPYMAVVVESIHAG
jgi:large subunit ribosomal protein L21